MKKVLAIATAVLVPSIANAWNADYSCQYDGKGKAYPLHIDDVKQIFNWQGKTYKAIHYEGGSDDSNCISSSGCVDTEGCAKYCFDVTGNGVFFRVQTATQGMASFTIH